MKKMLLVFLLLPTYLLAQTDCNFKTIKNPLPNFIKGETIDAISVNTDFGKTLVSKTDSVTQFIYKVSGFNSAMTAQSNDISIRLDSAHIAFDRFTTIKVKINGYGVSENRQALKPAIRNPTFVIYLTEDQKKQFIQANKIVSVTIFGERNTEGSVTFWKGELKKVQKSLQCIL